MGAFWRAFEWEVIAAFALVSLILGTWGFWPSSSATSPAGPSVIGRALEAVYKSLQLFVLGMGDPPDVVPPQLNVARFLAPLVAAAAAVRGVVAVIQARWGTLRIGRLRGHTVVCGGGARARHAVRALAAQGVDVALVEPEAQGVEVRGTTLVAAGDPSDPEVLRKLGIERAELVLAVTEDDAMNFEIAAQCRSVVQQRADDALACVVDISNPVLWRLLCDEEFTHSKADATVHLEFVNLFDTGARLLLDSFPPFPANASAPVKTPHVLVAGLGRLGRSLLVRAAMDWRVYGEASICPIVTVLDQRASTILEAYRADAALLFSTFDVRAVDVDVESGRFTADRWSVERGEGLDFTTAYICFGRDEVSVTAALRLRRVCGRDQSTIVARVSHERGWATVLSDASRGSRGCPVHPFPLFDRVYGTELLRSGRIELMARASHAAYVRHERAKGHSRETNASLVDWGELTETKKAQNRDQARTVSSLLEAYRFRLTPVTDWDAWRFEFPPEVLEALARAEHDRWRLQMERRGYRLGSTRDDTRRTHPDIRPWAELSEEVREKDRVMVRSWPEHLFFAGFEIRSSQGGPRDHGQPGFH